MRCMHDCLIVGGGVIGLSLAYELACAGRSVRVIDRGQPGQESSWAGAGILPPGAAAAGATPYQRLAALSAELHPQWAMRLRDETGLDNGYRRCGGVYLARHAAAAAELAEAAALWRRQGLRVEELDGRRLREIEPHLAPAVAAYLLGDEAQLRNPRHLKALGAACVGRGVEVSPGVEAEEFVVHNRRVTGVRTAQGTLSAAAICICGGAWSRALAVRLGIEPAPAIRPVRGQIALLAAEAPLLGRVINDGPRYLVPRNDGRVLVGSTEEEAGFHKQTTAAAIQDLLRLAIELAPRLAAARLERCWAGLRPATADGLPYLGPLPGLDNAFIAAGHFRQGLLLAPATAVVLAQVISGQPPAIDLQPFRVDRPMGQDA